MKQQTYTKYFLEAKMFYYVPFNRNWPTDTGSPHIRLEQTTFIGRVCEMCRPFFNTRAERAVC